MQVVLHSPELTVDVMFYFQKLSDKCEVRGQPINELQDVKHCTV